MSFGLKKLLLRTRLYRLWRSYRLQLAPVENHLNLLSDRLLAAPLDLLTDETLLPQLHGPDAIHLAQSAPTYSRTATLNLSPNFSALDLQGLPELRRTVRDRFYFDHPSDTELLITAGATAGLATVLDSFINPGDGVVLLAPTCPFFPIALKHRRAQITSVPTWVEEGRLRFDQETLRKSLRGNKLLLICDPCNPTGATFTPEELEPLAFWCNKYNLLVYFDESFAADRYDTPRSRFAILPHLRDRTLSAMSCTPRYGLTAAKVGWLAGCDSLIRACRVTQGLQANHPSLLAQQIALSQLQQEVEPTRFRDRIEYTLQRLESMGLEPIRPSAGYFIWCSVKPWGRPAREIARQLLVEQRVVVQPGDLFGPGGSDYLRLSVGIDEGRLREGLERFGQSGIGNRESGKPLAVSHTEF